MDHREITIDAMLNADERNGSIPRKYATLDKHNKSYWNDIYDAAMSIPQSPATVDGDYQIGVVTAGEAGKITNRMTIDIHPKNVITMGDAVEWRFIGSTQFAKPQPSPANEQVTPEQAQAALDEWDDCVTDSSLFGWIDNNEETIRALLKHAAGI